MHIQIVCISVHCTNGDNTFLWGFFMYCIAICLWHVYTLQGAAKNNRCRIWQFLSNRLELFDETLQLHSVFILHTDIKVPNTV